MAKIKVGQIGIGHAHASKLSVYLESPDYEVVGLVETDPMLREASRMRAPYKDVPLMTREQLLNVPELQVVLVETRVRELLDNAEVCVNAGKHVHLDKPAGESLPHYRRILEAASAKHLMVQMGYMYRYNPAVVMMRDFLRKGWLGEPFEVHTVMSKVVPPPTRKKLAEYPGGIMFELGCHIMDLAVGVLGKPVSVHSFRQQTANHDDTLVDNMLAVLEYPKAIGTVKSSANEVEGFARRHLAVCGSEGTFHIQPLDNPQVRVALSRKRGSYSKGYQDVPFKGYSRYVGDAADMAKVIRGEKDSDFSYEHDLTVQECVLRASGLPLDK